MSDQASSAEWPISFFEHAVANASQYDGTCRAMALEIIALRKQNATYMQAIENAAPTYDVSYDAMLYDPEGNAHAGYGGPIISRGALRVQHHAHDDYPSVNQIVYDHDTRSFETELVGYLLTDEDICDLTGEDGFNEEV